MLIQISSGQGPTECSLAVEKLCNALQKEYKSARVVSINKDYSGFGYKSATMEIVEQVQDLEGTILWICRSPLRKNHPRKNWYVDVSVLNEVKEMGEFREEDCSVETMHSGGKGGQNVNKVETGVRIKHIPTGITVECTEERSQYMNKQKAFRRLRAIIYEKNLDVKSSATAEAWSKHTEIVRGNPVRIYEGDNFKRKKCTLGKSMKRW